MRALFVGLLGVVTFGCSVLDLGQSTSEELAQSCSALRSYRFEGGSPDGHPDPFGALAAHQARAGKITKPQQIVQGPYARHKVRLGDYALANDKIALYIEAANRPQGYAPFGGEILGIEPVGTDGRPVGLSKYNETLMVLSRQTVKPDSVTVLNDGSNGQAAVIRVSGVLTNVPFLEPFAPFSPPEYGFPAAVDYILEPHAEKVTVHLSLANTNTEEVDFSGYQRFGFFQQSRSQTFSEQGGFAGPAGDGPYVAFDGGDSAFLFHPPGKAMITGEFETTGLELYSLQGLKADACSQKSVDYVEIMTSAGGLDGVLETKRRVYGEPAWREIKGVVTEQGGARVGNAMVHAQAMDGKYLNRVTANANGEFTIHVPEGPVNLVPTIQGWDLPQPTTVEGTSAELVLPKHATIEVHATDQATGQPIPVRVQIIPTQAPTMAPNEFGLRQETNDRLWQEFAVTGNASLPVPPGQHRVIVSRGFEYEILDTLVSANAGQPTVVNAPLLHSVDTTGVMCADFHVHAQYSVDSSDPYERKLQAAVADGLEIATSSEHEWIADPRPVLQRLGLSQWASGLPSEELTTFQWGHFGIIPKYADENAPNNGAVPWIGKTPQQLFQAVHALPEKPVLIVNHPDSDALQGYFIAAAFSRETASGNELWSNDFTAIEAFNNSDFEANRRNSVADWFTLLNTDKTYWAVGSSDTHDERSTFVGYPRNCMQFGHDDPARLTPEIIRDVLKTGASTVNGGLYMTVKAPDGAGPGQTSVTGNYHVTVQAPGWLAATQLETFVDGFSQGVVALTPAPNSTPAKRYEVDVNVQPNGSRPRHWVVFTAKGDGDLSPLHPTKKPFVVSNPIFF